jgi:hypothetical protein
LSSSDVYKSILLLLAALHLRNSISLQLPFSTSRSKSIPRKHDSLSLNGHIPKSHLLLETMAPMDAIPNLPVSPAPQTPPSSPDLRPHKWALPSEQVQLLADLLKAVQAIQSTPAAAGADQPATTEESSSDKSVSRERGLRLEYKTVHETYVPYKRTSSKKANVTSLQLG